MDKEFTDFGILFQNIICDLKVSYPLWEDLIKQCGKFHSTLRLAIAGMTSFLESFQKLADFAMEAKGGPRDLGSSMIRLCLRHKALENHLKSYNNSLIECLVIPLQEKLDEWKKSTLQLDKEHGKESKKIQGEVKKASLETIKLQKKVNKGKTDAKSKLELSMRDYNAKTSALEMSERSAIVSAISEHRSRFSFLVGCIKPIVANETAMLGELESFKDIMCILEGQTVNPSGIIEQTFLDSLHGFNTTLERKKKSIVEESELMGTISRSSSSSSQKSGDALKADCSSLNNPSNLPQMTRAPLDDIQHAPVVTMTVDDNFFFHQEFATLERVRTIFPQEHPQSCARPNLTADTFVPPPSIQQQHMQQQFLQYSRQQSFPSTTSLSSTSSGMSNSSGSKKVEKIYARPALVRRENSIVTPVYVAPPTVPDLPGIKLKQNIKNQGDISLLNQVILDLEKNNKILESSHPCPAMSLQSLQSMQCSSGYGTMTNISSNSNETMQSIAELDALLETSLSDLEKCCTLPVKRFHSKTEVDNRRPVSSSDEVPSGADSILRPKNDQHPSTPTSNSEELPPPPDDFLTPQPDQSTFPSLPNPAYNHCHYHQPQVFQKQQQQKELNLALRQRFSQLHQNLDALPECQHIPHLKGEQNHSTQQRNVEELAITQTSPEPELSDFSTMLRGVSLRRTIVNDRSAPMLKKI